MLCLVSTIHFQLTELSLLLANFFIFIARVRDRFFSPKHARRREKEWKRHKLLIFDDKLVSLPPSILSCWVDAQVSESGCFRENVLLRYHALSRFRVEARTICCERNVCSVVAAHKLVTRFLFFNVNVRVWSMGWELFCHFESSI